MTAPVVIVVEGFDQPFQYDANTGGFVPVVKPNETQILATSLGGRIDMARRFGVPVETVDQWCKDDRIPWRHLYDAIQRAPKRNTIAIDNLANLLNFVGGQARLARALGISQQAISKWIATGRVPFSRVQHLEALFGIDLSGMDS